MRSSRIKDAQAWSVEAVAPPHAGTNAGPHALAPEAARLLSEGERQDDSRRGAIAVEQPVEGSSVTSTRKHVETQCATEGDRDPIEDEPGRPGGTCFLLHQRDERGELRARGGAPWPYWTMRHRGERIV
jgi:hypothetical protein